MAIIQREKETDISWGCLSHTTIKLPQKADEGNLRRHTLVYRY